MKVIEPSFNILYMPSATDILNVLESAGRTCYQSDCADSKEDTENFIRRILTRKHESVIEHMSATVRIICDRGVSHELVRHRLCSFSQESTRYANYSKEKFGNEITVIKPVFFSDKSDNYTEWYETMLFCEHKYLKLLANGATPQEARTVLPNSLKTDIVVTANMREWRHIFKLRCSFVAHPQIRQVMLPLLVAFYNHIPVLFDESYNLYFKKEN